MSKRSLPELLHILEEDTQRRMMTAAIAASAAVSANTSVRPVETRGFVGRQTGSRNIERGKSTWEDDYLGPNPKYSRKQFRRRFRVPMCLFMRIHDDLLSAFPDRFEQRRSATGKLGHNSKMKILVALRRLGTGRSLDDLDDSCRMGVETIRKICSDFCKSVVEFYGHTFLNRRPTPREMTEVQQKYAAIGFQGCVGSVDCCRIMWKNCPVALKGQLYNPKDGKLAAISVEAWCDRDMYVWHWFAGRCATNNDLTMIDSSPLFNDIFTSSFPFRLLSPYRIGSSDEERALPYFLVDGIYPDWPFFAKPISTPTNSAERLYTSVQEATRKDIERCFGVLQARFNVLRQENKMWYLDQIVTQSQACVIIHNLIVTMQKNGDFTDEKEADGSAVNVLTEFLDTETEHWSSEIVKNSVQDERVQDDQNGKDFLEQNILLNTHLTSGRSFERLKAQLAQSVLSRLNN